MLTPAFSVYLDLVRFLAAMSVLLQHTWWQFAPDSHARFPGHEAVVVFFVLSGYVITYTASRPGMTWPVYLRHRIARIVPVAWAALLLGLVLTLMQGKAPVAATLANMVFLGQSGLGSTEVPDNMAYWSLNYEVWYYLIFAAWLYAPARYRMLLTGLAMLVAGPKILLLFPVWLMGAWLYRRMPVLAPGAAVVLYAVTFAAAAVLWWFDVSGLMKGWLYHAFPPAWRAHHSTQVLYDLLLGAIVTVHFCAAARLAPGVAWLIRCQRPIRYLAGFSFSLYAFHGPLGAMLYRPGMEAAPFYAQLALGVFLLGQLTERRIAFFRRVLQGPGRHGAA